MRKSDRERVPESVGEEKTKGRGAREGSERSVLECWVARLKKSCGSTLRIRIYIGERVGIIIQPKKSRHETLSIYAPFKEAVAGGGCHAFMWSWHHCHYLLTKQAILYEQIFIKEVSH